MTSASSVPVQVPMPMFPLGTVLFPFARLPLHVFEPRYRVLVHDCLRNRNEFGVVLIERGYEVGGGDDRFGVGTVAHIVGAGELPDGRWVLDTVGDRRIRVVTWLPDDPYPVALVEEAPEGADDGGGDELVSVAQRAVRRALTLKEELSEPAAPAGVALSDEIGLAVWQLSELAPLGLLDRQRLLEADDAGERLRLLTELVNEEADALARRLAEG